MGKIIIFSEFINYAGFFLEICQFYVRCNRNFESYYAYKKKLYEGSNIHKCNRTESASKMLTF